MGFYYGRDDQQPQEKPPGCMDVFIITRAVFAIIAPLFVIIFFILVIVGLFFYMFAQHPALSLIPAAIAALAIWLFARWEQKRFRPPGA